MQATLVQPTQTNNIIEHSDGVDHLGKWQDFTPNAKTKRIEKDTTILIFEDMSSNKETFNFKFIIDVLGDKGSQIEYLYLGHDGIIYGTQAELISIFIKCPNLKEIHFCQYYFQQPEMLKFLAKTYNVTLKCI